MTKHQLRDIRKEQILNAAEFLFSVQGYENTTVDQIASKAGLSKGAIYWHFQSKMEILFSITDREIAAKQQHIIHTTWHKYGPEAFWKIHKEVACLFDENTAYNSIHRQLIDLSKRYPAIKKKLKQYYKSWDKVATDLLYWAYREGYYKKADYQAIAKVISALYDGLYMRKQLEPDLNTVEIITLATKLMYPSLLKKKKINN
ncbi:MAG: TetR/AcrR family transcriptional regulator [bacterium]|nr:TetR/AcrR family transcriptional regulator [bacterium]